MKIAGSGAKLARTRSRLDLKVYGMSDTASAEVIRETLVRLEGVLEVRLDVPSRRVAVWHAGLPGTPQAICEALRNIGFRALQKA